MKKLSIILLLTILVTLAACTQTKQISSFEECVAAGNPVMESYPRQCSANGQTFVEDVEIDLDENVHVCTDEEKAAVACTLEYAPVCAKIEEQVQCFKAPCDPIITEKTFGNGCGACAAGAISYVQGECESEPTNQLANPASVYCIEEKGEFYIVETELGQVGYCELPDGRYCEEWALFNSEGKECVEASESEETQIIEKKSNMDVVVAEPQPELVELTLSDLAMHNSEDDCYVVYENNVYDVTPFLPKHDGGSDAISQYCGTTDFEEAFLRKHGVFKVEMMMQETELIGQLS